MSVWRFPGPVDCEKRCASGPRQTGGSPGNKRGPGTWTHAHPQLSVRGQPPAASVISRSFESAEPLCASRTSAVARSLNLHCAVASRACIVLCTYLGRAAAAGERRESVWTAHVATGCGPHRSGSCLPASGALACTDRTAPSLVAFALQELVCPTACGLALLGVARILFNVARPLPNLSSPIKSTTETTFTPSTHLSPTFRARSFPPHPPRQ